MRYLQLADGLEKGGRGKKKLKAFAKKAVKVVKTVAPIAVNFIPGGAQANAVRKLAQSAAGRQALKFATSKAGRKLVKASTSKAGKFAIGRLNRVNLNKLKGGLSPKKLGLMPATMPDGESDDMPQNVAVPQTESVMVKSSSDDTIFGLPKTTALALGAAGLGAIYFITRTPSRRR